MDRGRVLFLLGGLLLPLGGLEARLLQLQIFGSPESRGDVAGRRVSLQVDRARRGRILDSRGRVLAEDLRAFDCYLVLEEYEKAPWPVAALLNRPAEEIQEEIEKIYGKIEKQVNKRPAAERRRLYLRERRTPYLLARNVPFDAALAIETAPAVHPGALIRESLRRHYPFGAAAGHFTGYEGKITANEAEFRDLLQSGVLYEGFEELIGQDGIGQLYQRGAFHDERVGRAGVEKSFDDDLRGRLGLLQIEREAGTSHQSVTELKPAEAGRDVELTFDILLQQAVEEAIAGPHLAGAAVIDVRTGAVLALASNSTYDPNLFVPPGRPAEIRRLMADEEQRPLQSRAYAQHFQLGSVFKIVSAVAALEEKKVRPAELLPCRGRFDENARGLGCWIWNEHRGVHGELNLCQALEQSCNCYFYETAKRLDLEPLIRWAKAFGFGAPTGLDLPGEVAGRLPTRRVSVNDPLHLSIGQGDMMASPLQAAVMVAVIANGGKRVVPHVRRDAAPAPIPLPISAETIEEVRHGLADVVFGARGTAKNTRLREFKAAGKTGSAQNGREGKPHSWFAGYAPFDAPRVAVAVFGAFAGHGGEFAAPAAAKILEKALVAP
ncbi:MAG TPA: penicillin-binding transpeptidase domain-containing protein [Planctomycetota bacterium]